MKKTFISLVTAMAGISVFAEMALIPIDAVLQRNKSHALLVAKGVHTNDIVRVAGYMAGTAMGENAPIAPIYAEGYFPMYRNDSYNTGLGYEIQAWSESLQKTVSANIFFYEENGGLYVYLYQFKVRANAVAAESLYAAGSYYEPSTTRTGSAACLCALRVWIAGRDRVADYACWKSTSKLIWDGVTPTTLTDFEGVLTGSYRPYLMHTLGYNASDADGVRSVQLQTWGTNDMTRAVDVSLATSGTGIGATVTKVRRDEAGDGYKVGNNDVYLRTTQAITDTDNGSGITVRGVEARVENRVTTSVYANYLQTSDNRTVVWQDTKVDDILSINGNLVGGWLSAEATDRRPYHLTFGDGQVSVQFQAMIASRLYCVKGVFVQDGDDVKGYVEYARYVDNPVSEGLGLGFDFDSGDSRIQVQKIQTSDSGSGYGGYGLRSVSAILIPESGEDVFVWKGETADGRLSQAANWEGGVVPTAGAKLYFRDPTPGVITNDFATGTSFEGLYFAGSGSNTVAFAGNALNVETIDNLSDVAKVHVSASVTCTANFEPLVGGGIAIDSLEVTGTLAPRGTRPLGPLGTVRAGQLSGGNVHAWQKAVYGLGGAFVRRGSTEVANGTFDYLDTAGFTREVFEIGGTNAVANRVELPNGQIFAVKSGVTSVPDLGPSGEDPHVNLAENAQLHIRAYTNSYARSVRFEGSGRVSFGATGYGLGQNDVFDGVTFATDGADYAILGTVTPGADGILRFAAGDPDGTARAITLATAVAGATDVRISAGSLKAGAVAIDGKSVTVAGGAFEPLGETVSPSVLAFSGESGLAATAETAVELTPTTLTGMPKTYRFTAGSSISLPDATIDLTGVTVYFDAEDGVATEVLSAASIIGVPDKVVSSRTGKRITYEIGEKGGRKVLTVRAIGNGLIILFR